jgi:hypothetical protein
MRNRFIVVFVLTGILILFGCAGSQSGWKAYNMAQDNLETLQKQYVEAFKAADPDVQSVWRERYPPLFVEANEALDVWEFALLVDDPTATAEVNYKTIKKKLLDALLEVREEGR